MELQYSGRASPSSMEEEEVLERKREAPKAKVRDPPPPTIYRGPRGGAGPRRWDLLGGRRPRGWSAPQGKWRRPVP